MKSSKKSKKGWTDRFKSKKSAKWFNNRIVSVGGKQLPYPPDDDEDNQVENSFIIVAYFRKYYFLGYFL